MPTGVVVQKNPLLGQFRLDVFDHPSLQPAAQARSHVIFIFDQNEFPALSVMGFA